MADILMPEARVQNRTGGIEFIQTPGPLVAGHRHYDALYDKGNIFCPCCAAKVIYRSGTASTSGSTFSGRRAHFALARGEQHEEGCDILTRLPYERHLIPDRTKGYRIHINSRHYTEAFNDEAGVYGRDAKGRIVILDADLRDRERKVINNAKELIELLESGDWGRIASSRVVFMNKAYKWNEFFIRPDEKHGHPRFTDLLGRLEQAGEGAEIFCAMVIYLPQGKALKDRPGDKDTTVKGEKLLIWREDSDVSESIRPQIFVNELSSNTGMDGFWKSGHYLAMGRASLWTHDFRDERAHYINVVIDRPESFIGIDLSKILKIGNERQQKRTARAGQALDLHG